MVAYNYAESSQVPGGVWYTNSEPRTSWIDANLYPKPHATKFDDTGTGTFPVILGEDGLGKTIYFEHEIGTDQVNEDGTVTTIESNIQSYDFDLQGQTGAGEKFVSVSRFIPDFKDLDMEL